MEQNISPEQIDELLIKKFIPTFNDRNDKVFLFIGRYLDMFLTIEKNMELIIMAYMVHNPKEHFPDYNKIPDDPEKIDDSILFQNFKTRLILEHDVFGSEKFSTQIKIDFLKPLMQIHSSDFSNMYLSKLFSLIQKLQTLRNTLAHNRVNFEENGDAIILKPKSEFKSFPYDYITKRGKTDQKYFRHYDPQFTPVPLNSNVQDKILLQANATGTVLGVFLNKYVLSDPITDVKNSMKYVFESKMIFEGGVFDVIKDK